MVTNLLFTHTECRNGGESLRNEPPQSVGEEDLLAIIQDAEKEIRACKERMSVLASVRAQAIRALRNQGMKADQIAERLGISRQRVYNILHEEKSKKKGERNG